MSVNCDVIMQWSARPQELTALGAALWRWCTREAGGTGIYQFLDNQGLADLIAGKLGVMAQQSDKGGAVAKREPNLFEPAPEPGPTHGAFDSESFSVSPQMWLSKHRDVALLGLGVIALAALAGRNGMRRA